MMYDEFLEKVKDYAKGASTRECSLDDYEKIEFVYTWHPAISAVGGKRQIAIIWQEFGMGMIRDMYPVAHNMEALEKRRVAIKSDLKDIEEEITNITGSYR